MSSQILTQEIQDKDACFSKDKDKYTTTTTNPDDSSRRYVMFPLQDDAVWKMYKKQVDCFWRAEEIDFSKDLVDWKDKLNTNMAFKKIALKTVF